MNEETLSEDFIPNPDRPVQFRTRQFHFEDAEVDSLIRVREARRAFAVTGNGLTAAVLDTGLRTTHIDFAGRVRSQRNFTADNGGNANDATDGHGHGTNVAGIIVANGNHTGMAPGAGIVPLKVIGNDEVGTFPVVNQALQWIIEHHAEFKLSVICLSLSNISNHTHEATALINNARRETQRLIRQLRELKIPTVVAAGNDYFRFKHQGMAFPAILRETISVGAVYDADIGGVRYPNNAEAFSTSPDHLTPFSQRLHEDVNPQTHTDIFAPGAPVTSSGYETDEGESTQSGTSQATPVVAGVILLMQEFHLLTTRQLPSVELLITCLRSGGCPIKDGDDESNNVPPTGKTFLRVNAFAALDSLRRRLQNELLRTGIPFR